MVEQTIEGGGFDLPESDTPVRVTVISGRDALFIGDRNMGRMIALGTTTKYVRPKAGESFMVPRVGNGDYVIYQQRKPFPPYDSFWDAMKPRAAPLKLRLEW